MKPLERYNNFVKKAKEANQALFIENITEILEDIPDLFQVIKEEAEEDFFILNGEDEWEEIKLRPIKKSDEDFYFQKVKEFSVKDFNAFIIVDNFYRNNAFMCGVNKEGDFIFTNRLLFEEGQSPYLYLKSGIITNDTFDDYRYIIAILSTILESVFVYED